MNKDDDLTILQFFLVLIVAALIMGFGLGIICLMDGLDTLYHIIKNA